MCNNINMNVQFPEIAKKIIQMAKEDQAMHFIAQKDKSKWNPDIDNKNTQILKEIVADIGWLTISRVGSKVSNKAWLLIQHADEDLDFQKECLKLMKDKANNEVNPANVAYLEDRIRVAEGRPQLYGTQFYKNPKTDKLEARPIESTEGLNKRRAMVGLKPFKNY